MKKILFVCLGNICRSPLAHGIAQKIAQKRGLDFLIDSAGTSNWHEGETPCENSIKIAKNYDVDIRKQHSRPIKKEDIHTFDYVVAMDQKNKSDMEIFGFDHVYLLGDFGGYSGADVPDPYFFNDTDSMKGFEKVYTMVASCVEDFITKVEHESL